LKGIIKIGTLIVPVINIRKRFGLPDREIELSDHLIIARTKKLILSLPVDEVYRSYGNR
jgi:purine-binding chemotaxis protein CheW